MTFDQHTIEIIYYVIIINYSINHLSTAAAVVQHSDCDLTTTFLLFALGKLKAKEKTFFLD